MRICKCVIIGLILACAFLMLETGFRTIRGEDDIRLLCANNLHQIGMAIETYHDVYGKLPPAVITSKDGKPLLSWRVLLLPFIEESALYQEFHLDEPWDSSHNPALIEKLPSVFGSRVVLRPGITHYLAITGTGAAFEKPGLTWNDFPDGRANTILIVEAAEGVPWTKPVDIHYNPDNPISVTGNYHQKSIHFSRYTIGSHRVFNALFADGSLHYIRKGKDPETLRAFLTRNGGEVLDWSDVD